MDLQIEANGTRKLCASLKSFSMPCMTISDARSPVRRVEVVDHRKQLVKKASERKITDPTKIILSAIPKYRTSRSHGQLPPLLQELEGAGPSEGLDEGGEDSTRITIVQVFTNARRRRQDELSQIPAVFVDD